MTGSFGMREAAFKARMVALDWKRKGADRRRVKREYRKAMKARLKENRERFGFPTKRLKP